MPLPPFGTCMFIVVRRVYIIIIVPARSFLSSTAPANIIILRTHCTIHTHTHSPPSGLYFFLLCSSSYTHLLLLPLSPLSHSISHSPLQRSWPSRRYPQYLPTVVNEKNKKEERDRDGWMPPTMGTTP